MNNNPLQKYFRKPSVYIKLPSTDSSYSDDVLVKNPTGEHAVYAMTALDEITSRTPDALFNGSAVVDIIKSCIPDILDPWQLFIQDLDTVLVSIRMANNDGNLDITSQCPKCEHVAEYTAQLGSMLAALQKADYESEFQIDDLIFKLRSLTYQELNTFSKEQFEIQKLYEVAEKAPTPDEKANKSLEIVNIISKLTMRILSRGIEYIKTNDVWVDDQEHILDFLSNCDRRIYNSLRDHGTSLRDKSTLKPMKISCANCSHVYEQSINLNVSDFFD